MPPGPVVLPVVNNVLSLSFDENFASSMKQIHERYGSIISLSLVGHGLWDVWVEGYDLIKEILYDPRFANRSIFGPMKDLKLDQGLAFAPAHRAKSRRKTVLQIMREVGIGKTAFVTDCEENIEELLNHIAKIEGKSINLQVSFSEKKELRLLFKNFEARLS